MRWRRRELEAETREDWGEQRRGGEVEEAVELRRVEEEWGDAEGVEMEQVDGFSEEEAAMSEERGEASAGMVVSYVGQRRNALLSLRSSPHLWQIGLSWGPHVCIPHHVYFFVAIIIISPNISSLCLGRRDRRL